MSTYIIGTRNPKTKKLLLVMDEDGEGVLEFPTEEAAAEHAKDIIICDAWGFDVIPAP